MFFGTCNLHTFLHETIHFNGCNKIVLMHFFSGLEIGGTVLKKLI